MRTDLMNVLLHTVFYVHRKSERLCNRFGSLETAIYPESALAEISKTEGSIQ